MLFKISGLSLVLLCLLSGNALAGQTTRVNVASKGLQSNGSTEFSPSISANGRYVAFVSNANNLVAGDKKQKKPSIYIRDRYRGEIEKINLSKIGKKYNDIVASPSISADGRHIAFAIDIEEEVTTTTVEGNTTTTSTITYYRPNVFVYDRITKKIDLMSVGLDGKYANSFSHGKNFINMSADGRYVTFVSDASNLVVGDTNETNDVFVRDRLKQKTERVNISSKGVESEKYYSIDGRAITINNNGRYIGFWSRAANLVPNDNGQSPDAFVYDRNTHKIERINILPNGKLTTDYSPDISISANGRYAVLSSQYDINKYVFMRDLLTKKTTLIKKLTYGDFGWKPRIVFSGNALSSDGRYLAFMQGTDYSIYDRVTDSIKKVGEKNDNSYNFPAINADGRYIAFNSNADNLVANDTNKASDIFIHDHLLDTKKRADLQITATTKPAALNLNTQGIYRYTITNNGKDAVPNFSLIHLISGGSAVSFKTSHGKCSFSKVETVCHLGKLAAGKKTTLSVTVKAESKSLRQQVTVNGAPVDMKSGNNQITVATPVK